MSRLPPSLLPMFVLAGAACSGPEAPWSEAPAVALDLKLTLSSDAVPLLQPVTVQLDRWRRPSVEVEFDPAVDAGDFLAEITTADEVEFGDGLWQRTTLVLRPVRGPGELKLPSFAARATDGTVAATTPERVIEVTTLLAGHGAELEPPGEPLAAPPSLLGWGLFVLGWVAALTALWWLTRGRRPRGTAAATAVPPHIAALRALQRLRTAARATPVEIEAFYVEISHVLRVYLEQRFALRAPERTTEEFLRDLELGSALAREHKGELGQFLSQCDLVKFAAYVPSEHDHLATFAIAEAFVERTRPDRAAPAPPPAAAVEEVRA